MAVETLSNGQIVVTSGNLTLTQTETIPGFKTNEGTVFKDGCYHLADISDEKFKKLFIELHNYKNLV